MAAGRCQICGRRKALRLGGTIVSHYVGGRVCFGSGKAPLEQSDAGLERYCQIVRELREEPAYELRRLQRERANYIPPHLDAEYRRLNALLARLERRLARHRSWPERYARQMAERGYADVPPVYLIRRAAAQSGLEGRF